MDERFDTRLRASAEDTVHRVAPWRPDIAWWIVGLQGIVALLLGLWLLLNQGAGEPVLAMLGLAYLVIAVFWAWSAMRSDLPQLVLGWRGLRGGVGILTGGLVVLDFLIDFLTPTATLIVFAIGLLLAGAIGVAEWLVGRTALGWRWPSLVGSAVSAAFGFILLLSRLQAAPVFLQVLAISAVVIGVLLLVRAALLVRQERALRGAAESAASSVPVPIPQSSAGAGAPTVTVRSAAAPKPGEQGPDGGAGPAPGSS